MGKNVAQWPLGSEERILAVITRQKMRGHTAFEGPGQVVHERPRTAVDRRRPVGLERRLVLCEQLSLGARKLLELAELRLREERVLHYDQLAARIALRL